MYVTECSDDTSCNAHTIYISYLDSVSYLSPAEFRRIINHEIVLSYLEYSRKLGFQRALIWVCPPPKGDEYILF